LLPDVGSLLVVDAVENGGSKGGGHGTRTSFSTRGIWE
jgi:hypothetical protein